MRTLLTMRMGTSHPSYKMSRDPDQYIAHVREFDFEIQELRTHLSEAGVLSELFASAIGLPLCGRLLGLSHDLGKYSAAFRKYIYEITGLLGEDAKQAAQSKVGKIDHATAGAQHIWSVLVGQGQLGRILGQILAVVVMSHHSRTGMADFISLEGKSPFLNRLDKSETNAHWQESIENADKSIISDINRLLDSPELLDEFRVLVVRLKKSNRGRTTRCFSFGLLTRFLFSCLLDADRINTADFGNRKAASFRTTGCIPPWAELVDKLENHLTDFSCESKINQIRKQVSDECRASAEQTGNIFTLGVPTGGGKTLASLRFALHRALLSIDRPVERIIYIIPYTSIIDQNAEDIRGILGDNNILEHHSNITPEEDNWQRSRVLSENWDAPIVFTTSVQFLNALFDQGTKSARRMHQLANSILIFDEIQALPIKALHLFNNAINFLTTYTNTTALLCTATMPLLHRVDPSLGALASSVEIISDKGALFKQLKRTEIIDKRRAKPWFHTEIRDFALECVELYQSVLIVCNTKDSAQRLFEQISSSSNAPEVIHLSTSMCPAHRKEKIASIKSKLSPENRVPVVCVSTQLIEAGVDIDFGCVIRSLAGMDSVVQAGGRCNRHNERNVGYVYIMNFAEESLGRALIDIANAQQDTVRVLADFQKDPKSLGEDLLSEAAMDRFYEYSYFKRAREMIYPLEAGKGNPPIATKTSMLDLLSENLAAREPAKRELSEKPVKENSIEPLDLPLNQAFSTAAQAFQVIDAPTQGILVPYGKGTQVIADLSAAFANEDYPLKDQVRLLKQAQQYAVNAFPHMIKKLEEEGALREVQPESEIFYIDERYYHKDLGVTLEALSEQHYIGV